MKKTFSIILAVMMIIGTLSVLTILPSAAEEAGPVNLIVNGDFEGIDTNDDGTNDKWQYTAEDQAASTYPGEFIENRPVGWRTNSATYSNASISKGSTLEPAGYITNYHDTVGSVNQGQIMFQDIKIEAGKTYVVSAKLGFRPNKNDSTTQTKWSIDMFLDAETGITNGDRSVVGNVDWSVRKALSFVKIEGTDLYGAGDMTDETFTFNADDFIAANGLTPGADGKYHARLVIYNYSWSSAATFCSLIDDVTMFEVASISAADGGYITGDIDANTGDSFTVTAVPYYGNTFAGWYKGDTLVSSDATYSGTLTASIVAKFNVYNQVVDGNFESGTLAGQNFFNKVTNAANSGHAVVIDNPTGGNLHGNKVLKVDTTTANNTNCDILTIPFEVKKNTRYAFHISYYSVDINATAYVGLHANKSFVNGWTKSTFLPSISYHWEPEGVTNKSAWSVYGGYNGSFGMMRDQSHATVNAGKDKWIDYWVTFETCESTTVFEDGKDTADMFFLFGVSNTTINTFYIDNVSITEAKATKNDAIKAVAGENGTVSVAQPELDYVYYANHNGAKVGTAPTIVAGSDAYSQVAITTYTATANNGYIFAGWYDENNNLVSTSATTTFSTNGTYTAKFGQGHACGDGGYLVQNTDGTVTAVPYYGNVFLGWYDGDTLADSNATTTNNGLNKYTAKFAVYNQIVDGAFDTDLGLSTWQGYEYSNVFHIDAADGLSGAGMNGYSNGNSMMAIRYPLTVKKNTAYTLQFNMKIGKVTASSETATPVWSPMFSGSPDGETWGNWPKLDSYKITLQSMTDPTKQYVVTGFDTAEIHQANFYEIKDLFGDDWVTATIEIALDDDTSYSGKGNLFANSDTATIFFAIGHNFASQQTSVIYDNMSFYETTDIIEFTHKENVRPVRDGIGPIVEGGSYSFKLEKDPTVAATVKHNGATVTAVNGVYTVILADENEIAISLANDSEYPEMGKDKDGNDLTAYNQDLYLENVWEGNTVYHETAIIYKDRYEIELMYPISNIVSVRSYDLQTYYVEGYDFEVNAEGNLVILPASRIKMADFGPTFTVTDETDYWKSDDANIGITEYSDATSAKNTIVITYEHDDDWTGTKQTSVEDELDVFQKLRNGEDVHIVFFGDSMTSGWSASGGKTDVYTADNDGTTTSSGVYFAPYAPNWMTMFIEGLKEEYPDANITWENLSLGGKTSAWGLANFEARYNLLKNKDIDLFLIGWGINDNGSNYTVAQYKTSQKAIIDAVRAKCSDVSVLLYGANCTNLYSNMYEKDILLGYETANKEIAATYDNVAANNLTSIFMEINERKLAGDLLGNNLNHANDFGCRIYAQVMLSAMSMKYTSTAATPAAPTLESKDEHSVTLGATAGYEYSMDGINWQISNIFSGLAANTEYSFYQRVARTEDTFESAASEALKVMTDALLYVLGDINEDALIDTDDVVLVLQYIIDPIAANFSEEQLLAADVNGDTEITNKDALAILAYTVGARDSF